METHETQIQKMEMRIPKLARHALMEVSLLLQYGSGERGDGSKEGRMENKRKGLR